MAGPLATRDHLPELDGLRAIAVLIVLWGHIRAATALPAMPFSAYVGVDLFFVLSGFLITRILLYDRAHGVPLGQFWLRRAARIFPPFYLMLLLVLAVWGPSRQLLTAATYTWNYASHVADYPSTLPMGHVWSLCVEEHFYLLWPLAVALAPRRVGHAAALMVVVVGFALGFHHNLQHIDDPASVAWLVVAATHTKMASLGLGAMVAYSEGDLRARPWRLLLLAGGAALVLWRLRPLVLHHEGSIHVWHPFLTLTSTSLAGFVLFTLGLWAATSDGWLPLKDLLRDRRLTGIGRISYGIYLYHQPIYWLCHVGGPERDGGLGHVLLAVALTLAAAGLSYRCFEQPILRWARDCSSRPRSKAGPLDSTQAVVTLSAAEPARVPAGPSGTPRDEHR